MRCQKRGNVAPAPVLIGMVTVCLLYNAQEDIRHSSRKQIKQTEGRSTLVFTPGHVSRIPKVGAKV